MPRRKQQLHALDELRVPDLWQRARDTVPSAQPDAPENRAAHPRKILTIAVACAVSVAAIAFARSAFLTGHGEPSPIASATAPLTSAAVVDKDGLLCTVTFPSSSVIAGHPTGAVFTLTNVTDRDVNVYVGNHVAGSLVFARDGLQLQDSSRVDYGVSGPVPVERTLHPDATIKIGSFDIPVLWDGPLEVTPRCLSKDLPPVTLTVASPGSAGNSADAIEHAVRAIGDPFAGCTPRVDGEWVIGTENKDANDAPPRDIRCGAVVLDRPDFDVVVLATVSPPNAPGVDLSGLADRIEGVPFLDYPEGTFLSISWWVMTVTRDEVICASHRVVSLQGGSSSYSGNCPN